MYLLFLQYTNLPHGGLLKNRFFDSNLEPTYQFNHINYNSSKTVPKNLNVLSASNKKVLLKQIALSLI